MFDARVAVYKEIENMVNGIWLILLGVLAVPSLILAKRPDAAQMLDKLSRYQGWMGVASAFWGFWGIIGSVLSIGWLTTFPIFWITYLANSLLLTALGILLGVGTAKTFIKDPTAQAKMDQTLARIAPFQGTLGIAAIVCGLWMVVASFMFAVT